MNDNTFLFGCRILECYPKTEQSQPTMVTSEQIELFFTNAFLILRNREQIFNDSRLFLTPVPIKNCVGYSNPEAFANPTLGVYLQWWEQNPSTFIGCGDYGLVYELVEDPLSGGDTCIAVNSKGEVFELQLDDYSTVCKSFINLNKYNRYAQAHFQAYTLAEAIEILRENDSTIPLDYDMDKFYLESKYHYHHRVIERMRHQLDVVKKRITAYIIRDNYDVVSEIYRQYTEMAKGEYDAELHLELENRLYLIDKILTLSLITEYFKEDPNK